MPCGNHMSSQTRRTGDKVMAQKAHAVKFSMLEDRDEMQAVYQDLERFIKFLAVRNAGDFQVLMSSDELIGELNIEFVKGFAAYNHLPKEQLKAVLRKMFDNRIVELKCRFYETHRKSEKTIISLDIDVCVADISQVSPYHQGSSSEDATPVEELVEGDPDSAELVESKDRVLATREMLSPTAKKVFDALVFGNQALAQVMYLVCQRAAKVFKESSPNVKAWHIADALNLDEEEVKIAIKEIKNAYAEVCDG